MNSTQLKRNGLVGLLDTLPPFLVGDIIDDSEFSRSVGLIVGKTMTVGPLRFRDDGLFNAVRSALRSPGKPVEITDNQGRRLSVHPTVDDSGRKVIAIELANVGKLLVSNLLTQSPRRSERRKEFATALHDAGLAPTDLDSVKLILDERPLNREEQFAFERELKAGPYSVAAAIDAELEKPGGEVEVIVPTDREYYQRLCGVGDSSSVEELATNTAPVAVDRLLAWDRERGAQYALLLAAHPDILAQTALANLSVAQWVKLAKWALEHGDPIAKTGVVELALAALPRTAKLAPLIQQLVLQLCALDPDDLSGPLNLLSAIFIFVTAQLSKHGTLDDWPPFRRRQAALAQAALFTRQAHRIDVDHFSSWAVDQGVQRFYLQCLTEMRQEPRWLPDYATPAQFKSELLGRVQNAAGRHSDKIKHRGLKKLLLGEGPDSLAGSLEFPSSFLPGPLEGSTARKGATIPPAFDQILDETLSGEKLTPSSVIALINTSGLYGVADERVVRAVELIRANKHRFVGDVDIDSRNNLVSGLAGVAAAARSTALAQDMRVMLRKLRIDGLQPPEAHIELLFGMRAAAAFELEDEWLKFVGDWANELAFAIEDREQAKRLELTVRMACEVVPSLRVYAGRGLAALKLFRRS